MSAVYAPAYMHRGALRYVRKWIENSLGDTSTVDDEIEFRRLEWAGLVREIDEDTVTFSSLGMYVVELLKARSYNFFRLQEILDIWPMEWITAASVQAHKLRELPSDHTLINFIGLFQLEFSLDYDLKNYIADRTADPKAYDLETPQIELPAQLVEWPERSVDFTRASDVGDFGGGLEASTGDLALYLKETRARGATAALEGQDIPESFAMELTTATKAGLLDALGRTPCGVCEGSGDDPFDDGPCKACGGSGVEPGTELTPDEEAGEQDQGGDFDDDDDAGFSI